METNHKLFEATDSEALAALPKLFQDVTCELISAYEVEPRPVVATALAIAAATFGSVATVTVPQTGYFVTPAFNVVLSFHGGRSPGWLDLLRAPLFGPIFDMQRTLSIHREGVLQNRIKTSEQTLAAARKSMSPDPALLEEIQNKISRQRAELKPALFTNRFTSAHLEKVIEYCFDGAVFLTDPGADPVESFLDLKRSERRDLVRHLNCSWAGIPLNFGFKVPSATLTLFWTTQEEMLLPLFESEAVGCAQPPPILWIRSPKNQLRAGRRHGIANETGWKSLIEQIFDARRIHTLEQFRLDDEAQMTISDFERGIEGVLSESESLTRQLIWLPELAMRLALIFTFFNDRKDHSIHAEAAGAAVMVVRWLAAEHLRVLLTFSEMPVSPRTDNLPLTDMHDPAEVMLRKIRQKAPVTRRKLWQSYNDPKAGTFQSVLNGLLRAGKIVTDSNGCFTPDENGGSATVMAVE